MQGGAQAEGCALLASRQGAKVGEIPPVEVPSVHGA
jgi:hypothetical protein